jgi:hypothetical protein
MVFLALWFLSLIIRAIHMISPKINSHEEDDGLQARQKQAAILTGFLPDESPEDSGFYMEGTAGDSSDQISGEANAAVVAALEAYMSLREPLATPVFLRQIKDSGAWGRMAKYQPCVRQPGSFRRYGCYTNRESSTTAGKGRCNDRWR